MHINGDQCGGRNLKVARPRVRVCVTRLKERKNIYIIKVDTAGLPGRAFARMRETKRNIQTPFPQSHNTTRKIF